MSMQANARSYFFITTKGFFPLMAGICCCIAFLGFVPTYFIPLSSGAFAAPPIVHIHAAIFFAWVLFFWAQTWFVYTGRTPSHREWGMAGIALATAMVFSVLIVAGAMIHLRTEAGYREEALAFTWVQVGGLLFFAGAIGTAIANIRNPDAHKRLMLVATVSLLDAPISRWVLGFTGAIPAPGAPPQVGQVVPGSMIADLLIVAAIAFDWKTRGKPHRVYLVAGGLLLLFQLTRVWVSETQAWHAIASWIGNVAG